MTTDALAIVELSSLDPNVDNPTIGFAFHSTAPVQVDVAGLTTNIEAFFNSTAPTASQPLNGWLSKQLSLTAGACVIKWYDIATHLNGTPHGPPFSIVGFTLGGTATGSLPAELAAVVDFHADLTGVAEFAPGSRPRARLRGRHYLGPFGLTAMQQNGSSPFNPTLHANLKTDLAKIYGQFLSAVPTGNEWCVWSRKNVALAPIVGGWVDENFEVQRRRQDLAGIKTFWT